MDPKEITARAANSQITPAQLDAFEQIIESMSAPRPAPPTAPRTRSETFLGPVIDIDQTAWFQIGVRYKNDDEDDEERTHVITVSCDHCGTSEEFETSERDIHPDRNSPRHIGQWMINHRRLHR